MRFCQLSVRYLSPAALKPYGGNARTHSPKQLRQIADSIRQFGFVSPILVDRGNGVIAGHGRLAAAKLLGMEKVPTVALEHMTDAEKRAYILADNKLAENAGWDPEILRIELQYLAGLDLGFDLTITGFSTPEIDMVLCGEAEDRDDILPDLPAKPVTQPGDLWLLGEHRLLCGDATQPAAFRRLMSGKRAQMIFVDPPYNVRIDGHARGLGRTRHREFAMASGEMTAEQFRDFLGNAFHLLARHSVSGAIHFVCMDWRHLEETLTAGKEAYAELKNLIVWNKANAGMGSFYRSKHELILAFKYGTAPHINNFSLGEHGRHRSNVWDYAGVSGFRQDRAEELLIHPTVKPIAMVVDAIKDCSHRGGIVLDSFLGSGTTLIAAERTGRIGYGIELDPIYVDVALRRWMDVSGGTPKLADSGHKYSRVAEDRGVGKPVKSRRVAHV
ncbi:MAG: site-specific DNA-methyltransferase [Alphaproteobacteria bacterium]